jgi:anti-sigma B factor antagonist
MSVITSISSGVYIIMPNGKLDTNTSPEAESLLTNAVGSGETKVVFDFSKTEYISSAGLRVILKTAKLLRPKNGAVALCNSNEQIQEVLEISGFLVMIKSFSSLDEAIAAVND